MCLLVTTLDRKGRLSHPLGLGGVNINKGIAVHD